MHHVTLFLFFWGLPTGVTLFSLADMARFFLVEAVMVGVFEDLTERGGVLNEISSSSLSSIRTSMLWSLEELKDSDKVFFFFWTIGVSLCTGVVDFDFAGVVTFVGVDVASVAFFGAGVPLGVFAFFVDTGVAFSAFGVLFFPGVLADLEPAGFDLMADLGIFLTVEGFSAEDSELDFNLAAFSLSSAFSLRIFFPAVKTFSWKKIKHDYII